MAKGKRGKSNKKKKHLFLKFLIALLITFVLIISIIIAIAKTKYQGNIKSLVLDVASNFLQEAEPTYILIVGISEDIDVELADTIMVCGYNPKQQDAFMVSIPRDTFIGNNKNRASGSDKINSCYTKGIDELKQEVEEIVGFEIDYYAIVKTSMLVDIVDTIGGVDFDVPIDMNYDDKSQDLHIHLKKGLQRIDGDKAEQLLRFRHNNNYTTYSYEYGDNDFGRMRTQREFIKAVIEQTISLKNSLKIKAIAEDVFENVETDMDKDTMLSFIPYALEMDTENIKMEQLPGASAVYNNLWFYEYYKTKTDELMTELTASFQEGYVAETAQ